MKKITITSVVVGVGGVEPPAQPNAFTTSCLARRAGLHPIHCYALFIM
jgi:hypothetical protein